jgi:hypothetical protein
MDNRSTGRTQHRRNGRYCLTAGDGGVAEALPSLRLVVDDKQTAPSVPSGAHGNHAAMAGVLHARGIAIRVERWSPLSAER